MKVEDKDQLVTPSRLYADLPGAFRALPQALSGAILADPELTDPTENVVIFRIDGVTYAMCPFLFMAAREIVRFQHSLLGNDNGTGSDHLRISFGNAPKDLTTVPRLVLDAVADEAVFRAESPDCVKALMLKDYRAFQLEKRGRSSKKESRKTALRHAVEAAESRAPKGFDVAAYAENIRALFAAHDKAFGLVGC